MSLARAAPTVLIVDDVPQNLAVLHDTLDGAGYRVLVATQGASGLERAAQGQPDIVLLDAVMPGMDGFEVCRALRADPRTRELPVIFMTGLTETEDVVRGFAAGGDDYLTKPVRPAEVLARISAHLQRAGQLRLARTALDQQGRATLAIDGTHGQVLWQTPTAQALLDTHLPGAIDARGRMPLLQHWLDHLRSSPTPVQPLSLQVRAGTLQITPRGQAGGGEWLLGLRLDSAPRDAEALARCFGLTPREAEVLQWVVLGKTNRDIADILAMSPRTADKHLQHVLNKLGVETRTAAAAVALDRLRSAGAD